MVDESTVRTVRDYLQALQERGYPIAFGVVFGSQAAGQASELSDIDLLVVSRRFDRGSRRREACRLWEVAAQVNSRIEPIPCGERQWEEDDESAIIEIARREGYRVTCD